MSVMDTFPPWLAYVSDSLAWSAGDGTYADGTLSWIGPVSLTQLTTVTYKARVDAFASAGQSITNTASVNDGHNPIIVRQAAVEVLEAPWIKLYHPMVYKNQ